MKVVTEYFATCFNFNITYGTGCKQISNGREVLERKLTFRNINIAQKLTMICNVMCCE